MRDFEDEDIEGWFEGGLMQVSKVGPLHSPVNSVSVVRNDKLDLILTATSDGFRRSTKTPIHRPGTIRQSDETIEFQHLGGATGVARGVVYQGENASHSFRDGAATTTQTCSMHSLEITLRADQKAAYVIEWLENVSDGFIWPDHFSDSRMKSLTRQIGSGDSKIVMSSERASSDSSRALHLRVDSIDLYVVSQDRNKNGRKRGQIVYRGAPSQVIRDRIRGCLSYVLGLPLVYKGYTEYCEKWNIVRMEAVDAFAAGGAVFDLNDQPPYPINMPRYTNMIEPTTVSNIVSALLKHYDEINFNELLWSYWYAMCSPVHMSAVYFGALIEQLQKNSNKKQGKTRGSILDEETWKRLKLMVQTLLEDCDIHHDLKPVVISKLSNLNQVPQNIALKRLFDNLGLAIGKAEMDAWRHRNISAHGGIDKNAINVILNTKILRLMFHRMIAGITYCSDRYVDYFNYDFPSRPVTECVPAREE